MEEDPKDFAKGPCVASSKSSLGSRSSSSFHSLSVSERNSTKAKGEQRDGEEGGGGGGGGNGLPTTQATVARAGDLDFPLDVREAVLHTLRVPGHTVITSGITLMICLFALAPIPVGVLSSMGLGAGITTFFAVFVNLTMTPCVLLLWPRFFSDFRYFGFNFSSCCVCCESAHGLVLGTPRPDSLTTRTSVLCVGVACCVLRFVFATQKEGAEKPKLLSV